VREKWKAASFLICILESAGPRELAAPFCPQREAAQLKAPGQEFALRGRGERGWKSSPPVD